MVISITMRVMMKMMKVILIMMMMKTTTVKILGISFNSCTYTSFPTSDTFSSPVIILERAFSLPNSFNYAYLGSKTSSEGETDLETNMPVCFIALLHPTHRSVSSLTSNLLESSQGYRHARPPPPPRETEAERKTRQAAERITKAKAEQKLKDQEKREKAERERSKEKG